MRSRPDSDGRLLWLQRPMCVARLTWNGSRIFAGTYSCVLLLPAVATPVAAPVGSATAAPAPPPINPPTAAPPIAPTVPRRHRRDPVEPPSWTSFVDMV